MPPHGLNVAALSELTNAHGPALVDEAIRQALARHRNGNEESLAALLLADREPVAITEVMRRLEELSRIGKPLEPAPARQGATPVQVERIGIRGNPVSLDYWLQSGWHFAQDNGWDAWFNIVPRPNGGYHILTPATRPRGSHGEAIRGQETVAELTGPRNIAFTIRWNNGPVGRYQCELDRSTNQYLIGETWDENLPDGPKFGFTASPMPIGATAPIEQPSRRTPLIAPSIVPNQAQNGYTVTVGGAGFVSGEHVVIEGRARLGNQTFEWTRYTEGYTDALGHLSCPPFGIFVPPGTTYAFRGYGEESGYTAEVGTG